eukprot:365289-Chlamydomonas_euryale.AAC.11
MADLPEGEAELLDHRLASGELSKWPVVRCRNIYVLPGVPHLLQQKWNAIKGCLTGNMSVRPFCNQVSWQACVDAAGPCSVYGPTIHQTNRSIYQAHDQLGDLPSS